MKSILLKKQRVDVLQYGRSLLSKCTEYTQCFLSDVYTNSTRTKKAQVKTAQSGRSMIEMLGVLAIVGVLYVGGIAGYSKVTQNIKVKNTIEQINQISNKLSLTGKNIGSYKNLKNYTAVKLNAVPSELIDKNCSSSSCKLTHPFNGNVTIKEANNIENYYIIYENLNKEACLSLVSHNWGQSTNSSLIGLMVQSGSLTNMDSDLLTKGCDGDLDDRIACVGGKDVSIPVNITNANTICNCTNDCHFYLLYY